MPSDLTFRFINAAHHFVLAATRGRLGANLVGMQVVELTTIGRKSGEPRTVLLTSPLKHGDGHVVVASRGGNDAHPAWFLNLRENPNVEVSIRNKPKQPWIAQIVTGEERSRFWSLVIANQPRYAEYQKRTEREIPLVLLTPLPSTGERE